MPAVCVSVVLGQPIRSTIISFAPRPGLLLSSPCLYLLLLNLLRTLYLQTYISPFTFQRSTVRLSGRASVQASVRLARFSCWDSPVEVRWSSPIEVLLSKFDCWSSHALPPIYRKSCTVCLNGRFSHFVSVFAKNANRTPTLFLMSISLNIGKFIIDMQKHPNPGTWSDALICQPAHKFRFSEV